MFDVRGFTVIHTYLDVLQLVKKPFFHVEEMILIVKFAKKMMGMTGLAVMLVVNSFMLAVSNWIMVKHYKTCFTVVNTTNLIKVDIDNSQMCNMIDRVLKE